MAKSQNVTKSGSRTFLIAFMFVLFVVFGLAWSATPASGEPNDNSSSEAAALAGQQGSGNAAGEGSSQDANSGESSEQLDANTPPNQESSQSNQGSHDESSGEDKDLQNPDSPSKANEANIDSDAQKSDRESALSTDTSNPGKSPTRAGGQTRLGDINTRFTVYPGGEDGGSLDGSNLSLDPAKDNKGVSVTVSIDLSTSGSEPANPGELELLIPRTIFEVRNMSNAKVELPYPADGTGDWKYSFVDESGNEVSKDSDSCKYIKLVNNIPIEPAHTQSMGIAYSVQYASDIIDGSDVDFQPTVTLTQGDQTETKTSNKLNVKVDTHIRIANATKGTGSKLFAAWNSAWGDEPSLPGGNDDYFFLMWALSAYINWDSATQPYELTYAEPNPVPDGGIICGYMPWYNNNAGSGKRDDMMDKVALLSDPPVKTVMRAQNESSSWFSGVLVAYKKPTTSPKEYTNTVTATITPYDGKDEPTNKEAEGKFTYKDLDLNIPSGEMYYLEKIKGWTANGPLYRREHGAIDRIRAGVPVDNIAYAISGFAYQYTKDANDPEKIKSWGAEYTSELIDDMLFLNVDADNRLGEGDYEITRINPYWEAYEYHADLTAGKYTEVEADFKTPSGEEVPYDEGTYQLAKDYPELVAWGRSSDTGEWIRIATFAINTSGRAVVKEIHLDGATPYRPTLRSGVNIPKGTGFTQIKYAVTANKGKDIEDNEGVIRVRFERRNTPGGVYHSP